MKNVNELITDLRNTPVPKGLAKSLIDVLGMPQQWNENKHVTFSYPRIEDEIF